MSLSKFFASNDPSKLTIEIVEREIKRLEQKRSALELKAYHHEIGWAAERAVNADKEALVAVRDNILADQDPIPAFRFKENNAAGRLVRHDGAIWQCHDSTFGEPGRSEDWICLHGMPATPRPSAPASRRAWNVKNLKEPKYPAGARKKGDRAAIDAAFEQFIEHGADQFAKVCAETGASPDATVTLDLLCSFIGVQKGILDWQMKRAAEAEERIAALEDTIGKSPWKGIWNDAESYPAGVFVTYGGSMWHANAASKGAKPGDGSEWSLAVKRGRDGKDAGR
jgi:hypothetical protein